VRSLLDIGVEKVSVNTASVRNPEFIRESSKESGKERLVVAIDGRKNPPDSSFPRLGLVAKSGSESTALEIVKCANPVEELGAGEILFTSRDTDDTEHGYDLEMTEVVAEAATIPVIALGGAEKLEYLYQAVTIGKAAALLAASVFHFGEISIPEAKRYLI
jgi:cyclase